ncbi:MAG: endonuclease III [Bdellovibrionales bacterium]
MKKELIEILFQKLAQANPEPKSELLYVNDYTLLVAVVLSAQMTDKGVNKATAPLFKKIKTPRAMVKLGEENLRDAIKSLNLYKTKAKNVIALSEILIKDHKGKVPADRKALESLPGVGRKTANVVLNVAFGEPTMAVDTHVFRLCNRTSLARGETPLEVEKKLLKVVPDRWARHAHHWLILHGRYVCKARKPLCGTCIIREVCGYKDKTV